MSMDCNYWVLGKRNPTVARRRGSLILMMDFDEDVRLAWIKAFFG